MEAVECRTSTRESFRQITWSDVEVRDEIKNGTGIDGNTRDRDLRGK